MGLTRHLWLCAAACGALAQSSACLLPQSRMSAAPAASAGDEGSPHNLLANSTFDGGISLPWTASFTVPAEGETTVTGDALCLDVRNIGANRWDAQIRHREMVIQKGHAYRIRFRAWSDKPTRVRPKVGMAGPPYAEYWADTIELDPTPRQFSAEFAMAQADDPTAELAFHAGAELAHSGPFRMCIDDVVLEDPEFTRAAAVERLPVARLVVNQIGYLPRAEKLAVVRSQASAPESWELIDASAAVVAKGSTVVHGADAASGEHVHVIDFSKASAEGEGYRLRVGALQSHPFAIRADLYAKLRRDALAFFYHQRSGVEIRMPFAVQPRWARPAGHKSDRAVPCAPSAGCNYELDGSGGWYDAGDHGKYVVNAGISVWTLLDLYERSAVAGTAAALGDRSLAIPEAGNGVSDLLDEVRFELEWMLRMQVPEGKPLAGMAHHKLHGNKWTEIGTAPHEDKVPRFLYRPSTAATLNLAAVAAQASRIYRSVDPAFSQRCLKAAQRAWKAAQTNPSMLAQEKQEEGGGPYGDSDVRDEFYWAAAELLVTTGAPEYQQFVQRSPLHGKVGASLAVSGPEAGQHTALTWQSVAAAGVISLALATDPRLSAQRSSARAEITRAADELLALRAREGFRLPFAAGPDGSYPWGSNSFVLNNALVLALAHDFTRAPKYLGGVVSAMDYVLGRNPLDQSYVTGYGLRPLQNPHHRFFARQASSKRPEPPPGLVSGGPNSALQDPYARGAGLVGQPPQKCFLDHIESWSTNEVTINWNAPLAWVTAYLDDQAKSAAAK